MVKDQPEIKRLLDDKESGMNDYRPYPDIEQPGKLKQLVARLSDWPDVAAVSCDYSGSLHRVKINITTSHAQPGGALAIGSAFSMEIFRRGNITISQMLDSIKGELEKAKAEFLSQEMPK